MNEEEYPSDTSDEDYVPTDGEAVSEEDHSGEEETPLDGVDGKEAKILAKGKTKRKRTKKIAEAGPRKRKGGIKLDEEDAAEVAPSVDDSNKELEQQVKEEKQVKQEVSEKKKADDLWADFMKDVGPTKPKPKPSSGGSSLTSLVKPVNTSLKSPTLQTSSIKSSVLNSAETEKSSKVTITKEYDFAGEVVKVTKEVDADSKEAKAELSKKDGDTSKPSPGPSLSGLKRPGGGLSSVLGKIGKKDKISTLDKSKLDWNNFKAKEGIDEELQIHNRGKQSYLERQAFLDRADYRQFEIERDLRMSTSKR